MRLFNIRSRCKTWTTHVCDLLPGRWLLAVSSVALVAAAACCIKVPARLRIPRLNVQHPLPRATRLVTPPELGARLRSAQKRFHVSRLLTQNRVTVYKRLFKSPELQEAQRPVAARRGRRGVQVQRFVVVCQSCLKVAALHCCIAVLLHSTPRP